MKDMLDREIMVGDTLAYTRPMRNAVAWEMATSKVVDVAPFAVQLESPIEGKDAFVMSDSSLYVICAWAKGSDAA